MIMFYFLSHSNQRDYIHLIVNSIFIQTVFITNKIVYFNHLGVLILNDQFQICLICWSRMALSSRLSLALLF